MIKNEEHSSSYKIIHWGTSILVFLAFILVWVGEAFNEDVEEKIVILHTWVGLTILFLFLPRIIISWIGFNRTPISSWADAIARITQDVMYFCMFALPVIGCLLIYYSGYELNYFGLSLVPATNENKQMAHILKEIHEFIANVFLFVLFLHISGAIKRHFIDKSNVLTKMFFKKKS